jgi:hypothetical protein
MSTIPERAIPLTKRREIFTKTPNTKGWKIW